MLEVGLAFVPLAVCFVFFQYWTLKLSRARFANMLKGMALAFIGLALFLQGVKVGFLPAGEVMGEALGTLPRIWVLIPIGFIIGLSTTLAEPSVHTLNIEVENASGGYIPRKVMLYTLGLGVGVSVAVSMARIILGIPLWYFLVPGYLLAFILTRWCSRPFIPIAFDSGVATGHDSNLRSGYYPGDFCGHARKGPALEGSGYCHGGDVFNTGGLGFRCILW